MNQPSSPPAFGSVFSQHMVLAWYGDNAWQPYTIQDLQPLSLHPATHVLQFASTCIEGLKAFRTNHGDVNLFRLDRHIARMQGSARALELPLPDTEQLGQMIRTVVDANRQDIPDSPGALYVRPVLIGSSREVAGSAKPATEACLYAIASPVGDLFAGGQRPLTIAVEEDSMRCTTHLGSAKAGSNYASALKIIATAKRDFGADQVLFCPQDDVQECGGANFLLVRDGAVLTKSLDDSFLPGVTRDSILTVARDLGYQVDQRAITVTELLEWVENGEAALCGTAAVLAGVGELVYRGNRRRVGSGEIGPHTLRLRAALVDIQTGRAPDRHDWLTMV